ncbi:hypothetical protein BJY01DRAFT_255616 [Aspergillus pseudoustus]|uniref:Uncharacterized protein n=1 Tax=Aspergillus pseudoustus TaxID=1810923 RepID=A0ABR4IIS7_9EURO
MPLPVWVRGGRGNSAARCYVAQGRGSTVLGTANPNADSGQLLNEFGAWLHERGTFSVENMLNLWPSVSDFDTSDGWGISMDPDSRLNPEPGAFDDNWSPDESAPRDPSSYQNI